MSIGFIPSFFDKSWTLAPKQSKRLLALLQKAIAAIGIGTIAFSFKSSSHRRTLYLGYGAITISILSIAVASLRGKKLTQKTDYTKHLPNEMLMFIFCHFNPRETRSFERVCKRWRDLCCSEKLWERLCPNNMILVSEKFFLSRKHLYLYSIFLEEIVAKSSSVKVKKSPYPLAYPHGEIDDLVLLSKDQCVISTDEVYSIWNLSFTRCFHHSEEEFGSTKTTCLGSKVFCKRSILFKDKQVCLAVTLNRANGYVENELLIEPYSLTSSIEEVFFDLNEKNAFLGLSNGLIQGWDLACNKVRRGKRSFFSMEMHFSDEPSCFFFLKGHQNPITFLKVSQNELFSFSDKENELRIWDLNTRACSYILPIEELFAHIQICQKVANTFFCLISSQIKVFDLSKKEWVFKCAKVKSFKVEGSLLFLLKSKMILQVYRTQSFELLKQYSLSLEESLLKEQLASSAENFLQIEGSACYIPGERHLHCVEFSSESSG